jgi:restriction system protein
MTVPDYQTMMTPLLRVMSDSNDRSWANVKDAAALELGLAEADRGEMLPSGLQSVYDNRVGWAVTYLAQACLLERPARGVLRITRRGLDALESGARVDNVYLRQFAEFQAFKSRTRSHGAGSAADGEAARETTPEELIESGYQAVRSGLAQELVDRTLKVSPRFFEQVVVRLLVAMGYGGSLADAGRAVGRSGDDGIDGIIKEDRLGLDVVYIQAKRWANTVGRPEIQAFAGSLIGQGASKGVFITTSRFSAEAREYVTRIDKRIVLIDGEQLAELMIDYGIGVTEIASYKVNRIDEDFFIEE